MGEHYEGRYINQEQSERYTRIAKRLAVIGLVVGLPVIAIGLWNISESWGPLIFWGGGGGTAVLEIAALHTLLKKT